MIVPLFLAAALMGQTERQTLVNTGPVESKFYIRAVIEDRTTEIPIINNTLPVIAVSRDGYGNLEMRLDYAYRLPYNGEKIIHYRPKPQHSPPARVPEPKDNPSPISATPSHHSDEEFLRQIRLMNELVNKLNELIKYQIGSVPQEEKTTPIPKY
jgi:hypothetical protein